MKILEIDTKEVFLWILLLLFDGLIFVSEGHFVSPDYLLIFLGEKAQAMAADLNSEIQNSKQ